MQRGRDAKRHLLKSYLLLVVVLVDPGVDGTDVQGPVEQRVHQVVGHVERDERPQRVAQPQRLPSPLHRLVVIADPEAVVHEERRRELVECCERPKIQASTEQRGKQPSQS